MEEANENSVIEEVATPKAETQEVQQEQEAPKPVDDKQEKNWRAVRQRLTELERENKEKDELLKRALQMQQAQPMVQAKEEPEDPDEDYIPKGKVKKLARKEVEPIEKRLEELEAKLAQQKQMDLVQSLRSKYPDFDDVVNPETIALFEEKEPELANTIAELKDPYKIGMQSYKFIKASGLIGDVPGKRHAKEAEKKLEKNAKTVQSPQAYDKRPMAQAFRLTEAEKTKLYEEMMQYGNMASSVPELR